jgi:hypothetical protein
MREDMRLVDTSILIAKYLGPVMLVAGLSMLVNGKNLDAVFEDFLNSPGLIYVAGVMALVMGLTIVIFHNIWSADWRGFITLFGWIGIFAGIFRMGFPTAVKSMGGWMMKNRAFITISAVLNAALGAYLTYKGFIA